MINRMGGAAVSHIPKIGDASNCLPGEAISIARDVDAGDVHLFGRGYFSSRS